MIRNETVDFICVGSGAAGLMGAAIAAEAGGSAVVLEATDLVGGAAALSGAMLWAPGNRWQKAAGVQDDIATARRYVERCIGAERASDPRWEVFLSSVNDVLAWLESRARMRFVLTGYPDSYGEWPEGRSTRHVTSWPSSLRSLGPWADKIRGSPIPSFDLLTFRDVERLNAWVKPPTRAALMRLAPRLAWRKLFGKAGMGKGLVVSLLGAVLRQNVPVHLNHRVIELVSEGGRVVGAKVKSQGGTKLIVARRGVLLGCGGFEYDEELKAELLPGPMAWPQSPPVFCSGDGIRLARSVGARLSGTDEGWYLPGIMPPGSPKYEGVMVARAMVTERVAPHSLWVNRAGERFVNESSQNAANSFYERDAGGALPNLPSFTICDQQFCDRYPLLRTFGADRPEAPKEVLRADSLRELAARLGINEAGLLGTVEKFNRMVRQGRDEQFGRGEGAYEQYLGDRSAPHPNLGTIDKPPFYGFEVLTSGVGTKGGAMTDEYARVQSLDGRYIPGLYAAGNNSAAFNGPITVAAGCTIPPAMVMARQAAWHALGKIS